MTLDARGTGMTLIGSARALAAAINVGDFVSVGLYRDCDAANTSDCLFGSTLALHSMGLGGKKLWRALCDRN